MKRHANIQFDPSFIEEAVFLAARALKDKPQIAETFHKEREKIYEAKLDPQEYDKAFRILSSKFFERLGFKNLFIEILREFPILNEPAVVVFVKRAWSKKEEESELYFLENLKTVFICFLVSRLFDKNFLGVFLRHELMRMSDMLDPIFEYSPHAALGGKTEMEDNLIRERFHLLWDISISARLRRKGLPASRSMQKEWENFEQTFFSWDKQPKKEIFQKIAESHYLTQRKLLGYAGNVSNVLLSVEG